MTKMPEESTNTRFENLAIATKIACSHLFSEWSIELASRQCPPGQLPFKQNQPCVSP
jgi:hypothetical protein